MLRDFYGDDIASIYVGDDALYERFYIGLPRGSFAHMDRVTSPLAFADAGQSLIRPDAQGRASVQRYLYAMDEMITRDGEDAGVRVYAELLRLLYFLGKGESAVAVQRSRRRRAACRR